MIKKLSQAASLALSLACLLHFSSCSNGESVENSRWQNIRGRDDKTNPRAPIYRAKIPLAWILNDLHRNESITDTTKPLCELLIKEDQESIRITIHNFPVSNFNERIPPAAQIARWKRQFDFLDPTTIAVTPQAFGGFCGVVFEGRGQIQGLEVAVMGWSMQLGSEHYYALNQLSSLSKQMQADYTIKAVGNPELIEKHREAILAFARTFELIEEIPSNS